MHLSNHFTYHRHSRLNLCIFAYLSHLNSTDAHGCTNSEDGGNDSHDIYQIAHDSENHVTEDWEEATARSHIPTLHAETHTCNICQIESAAALAVPESSFVWYMHVWVCAFLCESESTRASVSLPLPCSPTHYLSGACARALSRLHSLSLHLRIVSGRPILFDVTPRQMPTTV